MLTIEDILKCLTFGSDARRNADLFGLQLFPVQNIVKCIQINISKTHLKSGVICVIFWSI
jgi:hypothetical protein